MPGDAALQGLDTLNHTQVAGLPWGSQSTARSKPGQRKGREGNQLEVETSRSWILGWQLEHRPPRLQQRPEEREPEIWAGGGTGEEEPEPSVLGAVQMLSREKVVEETANHNLAQT